MNDDLPTHALSVRQPWAWAILHAGKDVENRSWRPPEWAVGKRIWIHAAAKPDRREIEKFARFASECVRGMETFRAMETMLSHLVYGGIIGSVAVEDYMSLFPSNPARRFDPLSDWFTGPVGWVLSEPSPCEFVPCKGMLGVWKVPDDVLARLKGNKTK